MRCTAYLNVTEEEKMMASLAIRVALINVSTLPKTNMLIIDEGFGALDETNLEACSKLLETFKKWFKNIIVINYLCLPNNTVYFLCRQLSNEILKAGISFRLFSVTI